MVHTATPPAPTPSPAAAAAVAAEAAAAASAVEAATAERVQAVGGLAALHVRAAYVRGGPRPVRTLAWDPQSVYPPVRAQGAAAAVAAAAAAAQTGAGTPAGVHRRRHVQPQVTPAQAQALLLQQLGGVGVPDGATPQVHGPTSVRVTFHRVSLQLSAAGGDLPYCVNASAFSRARHLP